MDWKLYLKKAHRTTSYWQKSGLSAKLNFCTSIPQNHFFLLKKCKLANKKMVLLTLDQN
jgi:hypothetical protein